MPKFQITADPKQDVGMVVGSSTCGSVHYLGVEGVHDISKGLSGKRRFMVHLSEDDILWLIESLAKELPEVLHDEAVARIESVSAA